MRGASGLSRAEREAIVVAVSGENRCQYCLTAHGAALRVIGKDPVLAEQIAKNWRTADLTPRLRHILAFASRVNEQQFAATDDEIAELAMLVFPTKTFGISRQSLLFGFSECMAGLMDMHPNHEFFMMRQARRRPKPRRTAAHSKRLLTLAAVAALCGTVPAIAPPKWPPHPIR